jgi:hypothetical protein
MIQAQGCTGKYSVQMNNQTASFTSVNPALLSVTYNNEADKTESAVIQSLDDNGNILVSTTIFSASFSVGAQSGCSVSASTAQATIPVDASGNIAQSISIPFQITGTSSFSLVQVLDNSLPITPSSILVTQPTPANPASPFPTAQVSSLSLQLPFSSVGQHTLSFQVTKASGGSGSCSSTVTLTPVTTTAPLILSFSASPSVAIVGEPVTLILQASGQISSASIDGTAASFTNGVHTRVVPASKTGKVTSTATVTGPGGTSGRQLTYEVAPRCQVRALDSATSLPGAFHALLDITGDFQTAAFSGTGITPLALPGGAGLSGKTVDLEMLSSPAQILVNVYGPDSTTAQCSAQAIYQAPSIPQPPAVSLTANSVTSNTTVFLNSNPVVSWTSSGAAQCSITRDGNPLATDLNGSRTLTNILSDSVVAIDCSNAGGHTTARVSIAVPGRWFQSASDPSKINKLSCSEFCGSVGLVSKASPFDGAKCVSGEVHPSSAAGIIQFTYGYWPNTAPNNSVGADTTRRMFCYRPNQKNDHDRDTDVNVGCFCGR